MSPEMRPKSFGTFEKQARGFVVEKAERGPGHMVLSTVCLVLKVVLSTADKSRQTQWVIHRKLEWLKFPPFFVFRAWWKNG